MANIINYVENNLDTFEITAFNDIDSLILSWFSYILLPKNKKGKLSNFLLLEHYDKMFSKIYDPINSRILFNLIVASPRFRDIEVIDHIDDFDSKKVKQFSATCFKLPNNTYYVAYRGTDNSFVGWKEDFNMAFADYVPSQEAAYQYINKLSQKIDGDLILGGHSKGGSLAIYSATFCDESIKDRIKEIYCHDGPGFLENITKDNRYISNLHKIKKTVPVSSIIGMLLENNVENLKIVKSKALSILQHDLFSWEIEGKNFIIEKHLSTTAKFLDKTITDWLKSIPKYEREKFVDLLFNTLTKTNEENFSELELNKENIFTIIRELKSIDEETKEKILSAIKNLISLSIKNLFKKP